MLKKLNRNVITYLDFHLQVIIVHEIADSEGAEDYLIGERGNQKGKVPKAFLEFLTY